MDELISRQAAIDAIEFGITYARAINKETGEVKELFQEGNDELKKAAERVKKLPSAQPKKEIAKRVLWTGWKGCRDTRYKCPNCKKPVKNDDIYCHRCGQKLMFPHISFTDYVPGEKQETIVRWDDE